MSSSSKQTADGDNSRSDLHDIRDLTELMTSCWGLLDASGLYALGDLAEVMSSRFCTQELPTRCVTTSRKAKYKEPARVVRAAALSDPRVAECECCEEPTFATRFRDGQAVKPHGLEACLSRGAWWTDGSHNQASAKDWIDWHYRSCGVKVLGETKIINSPSEGETPHSFSLALVSIAKGGSLWVCLDLLARLIAVRMFRPITEGLLASLRGRARLWAESNGIAVTDLVQFLAGTLTLALLPGNGEVAAMRAMRGVGYQWSSDVLGAFSKGIIKEPTAPWLGLRDVLRGWAGGGLAKAFERPVQSLVLPA